MSLTPALGRKKQVFEIKASLVYTASSRLAELQGNQVSKKKTEKQNNNNKKKEGLTGQMW